MRQERKVVTVLFCDLVGFTSRAEEMDPEDVAALLGPYHARLKQELERYGGTVEKFIGDAVMALFGAPVAHEDDPERAVRAAFSIRDYASEAGIDLRIGITTGEALVNLDARPDAGETMAAGDVVNTAARLQSAAPVGGIIVSEKTYEATRLALEYREAEPVEAKGKTRPVQVWEAVSATPLQERAHTTPLVGRERELQQLRQVLERVREERSPQLVTLVGPPGIGKSRLVYELSQADGDLRWRKGRCLPYGHGVAFWALGEIVKQHAGIMESDPSQAAVAKLEACSGDSWVASHLRPLVGVGGGSETLGDRRAEAFSAWRRFLTSLADEQPLALVFDDIHWADEGLLDFVSQLVEWVQESPLFVLCTARPELLERRPRWVGATVALAPLSDDETGQILSALVGGSAPEELVAKAAGNPLYAEQYARLMAEGGSLDDPPDTVQAIIAARLDGLPAEEKSLLQDAAVVGETFWSSAVAAVSRGDRWLSEEQLLGLERRGLVRRERSSSVEGDTEYAFVHILVRDVAYDGIPKAQRAGTHVVVAQWIELLGRPEEYVELRAHHYLAALELGRANDRARFALRDAGERSLGLSAFTVAVRYYRAALDLWPVEDDERPYLLLRYGRALRWAEDRGEVELTAARDALTAAGDPGAAAEADLLLADIALNRGQMEAAGEHLDHATSLVADLEASASKAYVVGHLARFKMLAREAEEAIDLGNEALVMATDLGLEDLRPHVLNSLGMARVFDGDKRGIADLETSIALAREANAVPDVLRGFNNLGSAFAYLGDVRGYRQALEDGLRAAEYFGEWVPAAAIRANLPDALFESGDWDGALRLADDAITEDLAVRQLQATLTARSLMRLGRDDLAGALADSRAAMEWEDHAEPDVLSVHALVLLEAGSRKEAIRAADEIVAIAGNSDAVEVYEIALALCFRKLGRAQEALDLLRRARANRWREAAELILLDQLVEAADLYAEIGAVSAEALLRLTAGQELVGEGRRAEAEEQIGKALAFWRSVGATRYIRQCEEWLAASA